MCVCVLVNIGYVPAENRSNTIVNLGKGIYGLKEWVVEGGVVIDAGDSNDDSKVSVKHIFARETHTACVCVCVYIHMYVCIYTHTWGQQR